MRVWGSLDAEHIFSQELSGSSTFYVIQCSADNSCAVHFLLRLTPPLKTKNQTVSDEQ